MKTAKQLELFPQTRFVGIRYLCQAFNLGATATRQITRSPDFPKRVQLVRGKSSWLLSDVEEWMRRKAEASQSTEGAL